MEISVVEISSSEICMMEISSMEISSMGISSIERVEPIGDRHIHEQLGYRHRDVREAGKGQKQRRARQHLVAWETCLRSVGNACPVAWESLTDRHL